MLDLDLLKKARNHSCRNLGALQRIFLIKIFVEIIIDLFVILRNNIGRFIYCLFSYPPVVTSFKTLYSVKTRIWTSIHR